VNLPRRSVLALPALALLATPAQAAAWTQTPFTFNVQKPWNLNRSDRYSYSGGVHTCWVYDTDEPHTQTSNTDPRTEMRWLQEYSTGRHAWEGEVYVPSGVNGPTVMQILRVRGGDPGTPATDIMLNVYNQNGGTLRRGSSSTVIATGIYNTWFRLRVEHAPLADAKGTIRVYFNGMPKLATTDNGRATRHFKNGVYHHGSGRAEARFRNITYWTQ
jgi:hypothetical protein